MEYGYSERDTAAITNNTNFFKGTDPNNNRPLAFSDQSWAACMMEIGHIIALEVKRNSMPGGKLFTRDPYRANYKSGRPHKMLPWAGKKPNAKSITGLGKKDGPFKKLRNDFNSEGMYSVSQIAYLFATTFKTFGDKFRYIDSYIFGIPMETCDSFLVIVSIVGGCMTFYTHGGQLLFTGPVLPNAGPAAGAAAGAAAVDVSDQLQKAQKNFKEMSDSVNNILNKLNSVDFDTIETENWEIWNPHKLKKPLLFKQGNRLVTQELLYKLHFSKALLIILSFNILNGVTLGRNRTVIVSGGDLLNELTLIKSKLINFEGIFNNSVPSGDDGSPVPPYALDYFLNELLTILWDKYEDITINYGSKAGIRDMYNFYFPLDPRRRSPEDLSDKLNNLYQYTKAELQRYVSARDAAADGAWTHIYGTDSSYGIDEMLHHLGLDLTSTSLTYDFYSSSDEYPKQHTKTEMFKELKALIPSARRNITSLARTFGGGKNQQGGVKVMVREQAREPLRREQYDKYGRGEDKQGAEYSISHPDYFKYPYKVVRDPGSGEIPYTHSLNHSEMISSIIFYELINTRKFDELQYRITELCQGSNTAYKYLRLVTRVGELGEAIVMCLQVTFQNIQVTEAKSEPQEHTEHIQGLHKSLSGILEKKLIIDRTVKNDKDLSTITVPFGSVQFNLTRNDGGYTTDVKGANPKPSWLSQDVDIEKLIEDFNLSANSIFLKFKNLEVNDNTNKLEILKKQFGLNMLHILDLICVKMYYVLFHCLRIGARNHVQQQEQNVTLPAAGAAEHAFKQIIENVFKYFLPDKKGGRLEYGPFDSGQKNHSETYAKMYQLMDRHYSLKSITPVFVSGNIIDGIINLPYYGCLELEANYSIRREERIDIGNILEGELKDRMVEAAEDMDKKTKAAQRIQKMWREAKSTQKEWDDLANEKIRKRIEGVQSTIQGEIFAIIDLLGDVYFFYNGKTYTTLLDAYDAMEFFKRTTIDERSEQNKYTLPLPMEYAPTLFTPLLGDLRQRENLPSNYFEEQGVVQDVILVNKDLSFAYENVNKLFLSERDPLEKLQIIIELIIQRNINITVADLVKIVRQVHGIRDVEDVDEGELHELLQLQLHAQEGSKYSVSGGSKRKTQKIRVKRRKKKTRSNTRVKGKKMTKKILVPRKKSYTRRKR